MGGCTSITARAASWGSATSDTLAECAFGMSVDRAVINRNDMLSGHFSLKREVRVVRA